MFSKSLTRRGIFSLPKPFLQSYSEQKAHFGFNGIGEMAYKRSYSRVREDGLTETWHQTVERVVNGAFNMKKHHLEQTKGKWDQGTEEQMAMKMYDKIFRMKFLPPGRGLWAMGSAITDKKKLYAALNNCAFVSTDTATIDEFVRTFTFLFDATMLGIGTGFDTKGAGKRKIFKPKEPVKKVIIEDSREGWVESLELILKSYLIPDQQKIEFEYSKIRPFGVPLKTFGGVSAGAEPLISMHKWLDTFFEQRAGNNVTSRDIVDLMNMIGKCVISGNIRRVAEIAFGEPEDTEFTKLKDYDLYPERIEYGWASNNSVFANLGQDYSDIAAGIHKNGEPGVCWLDNMRKYSRMGDEPTYRDKKAAGGNPCLEQTLETFEMCCLVETFPNSHESYAEYEETLEMAFQYAKIVTLGLPHIPETARVMAENRRIGTSMSGIAQFIANKGVKSLMDWSDQGYKFIRKYDEAISKQLSVPESIKVTSIKPSGTVSLLAGATPGVHYPHSEFYTRRMRLSKASELLPPILEAGYAVEEDAMDSNGVVIEIPVHIGTGTRSLNDVTLWEQLQIAAFMQRYWADNQVSCTVSFDPDREGNDIKNALEYFQFQLKGISFLPKTKDVYPQMPYEEITGDEYQKAMSKLKTLDLNVKKANSNQPAADLFCDGDTCTL